MNDEGDGCKPTEFSCPNGQVLNEDATVCVPVSGSIVPFPFGFTIMLYGLIIVASLIKDSKKTKVLASLIAMISTLELVMYLVQMLLAFILAETIIAILTGAGLVSMILLNIIYYKVLFQRYTKTDSDFIQWSKQYDKTSRCLPLFGAIINFKLNKFFYSGFFGLDTCAVMIARP